MAWPLSLSPLLLRFLPDLCILTVSSLQGPSTQLVCGPIVAYLFLVHWEVLKFLEDPTLDFSRSVFWSGMFDLLTFCWPVLYLCSWGMPVCRLSTSWHWPRRITWEWPFISLEDGSHSRCYLLFNIWWNLPIRPAEVFLFWGGFPSLSLRDMDLSQLSAPAVVWCLQFLRNELIPL